MKSALLVAVLLVPVLLSGQETAAPAAAASYRLGPSDLVTIRVLDYADEIGDQPFRIELLRRV